MASRQKSFLDFHINHKCATSTNLRKQRHVLALMTLDRTLNDRSLVEGSALSDFEALQRILGTNA